MPMRRGPTPLMRRHGAFLRKFAQNPTHCTIDKAGVSQLQALQEILQNVKLGNIAIPPEAIKGVNRVQLGKGLESACNYRITPRRLKSLLIGNKQTGGFALASLARFAIPIALDLLTHGKS